MKIPLFIDPNNSLSFPSLTISTSRFRGRIRAIIDTGSNTTFLSEGTVLALKLPYSSLPVVDTSRGISGGSLKLVKWSKPVILSFITDDEKLHRVELPEILIGKKRDTKSKKT